MNNPTLAVWELSELYIVLALFVLVMIRMVNWWKCEVTELCGDDQTELYVFLWVVFTSYLLVWRFMEAAITL